VICYSWALLQRELQQLTDTSGASGHQKLRVCDVCGAYLSVLDSDRRLADHFGGKVRYGCRGFSHVDVLTIISPCRCIWDTTSSETCFKNSKKNAKSERWHLLVQLRPVLRLCQEHRGLETTAHRVEANLVTETVIAAMKGKVRDTSAYSHSCSFLV